MHSYWGWVWLTRFRCSRADVEVLPKPNQGSVLKCGSNHQSIAEVVLVWNSILANKREIAQRIDILDIHQLRHLSKTFWLGSIVSNSFLTVILFFIFLFPLKEKMNCRHKNDEQSIIYHFILTARTFFLLLLEKTFFWAVKLSLFYPFSDWKFERRCVEERVLDWCFACEA